MIAYMSVHLEALVICLIYALHGMASVICVAGSGRTCTSLPVIAVCGVGIAHVDLPQGATSALAQ